MPDLNTFNHLSALFHEKEGVLLDLFTSEHITSDIVKGNITRTLLKVDLKEEDINTIVQIVLKTRDSQEALQYLPIVSHNFNKIRTKCQETLCLCYYNFFRKQKLDATIDKGARVALVHFFTKAILCLGRRFSSPF